MIDPRYVTQASSPYPLSARARFTWQGVPFDVEQVVQTAERIAGTGSVLQPLLVAPAISVDLGLPGGALPLTAKSLSLTATVHSNVKGPAEGTLKLNLPTGWRSEPVEAKFTTARDGEERVLLFTVIPSGVKLETYTITAVAEYQGDRKSTRLNSSHG